MFRDGADLFLEHHRLGGRRADDSRHPPQMRCRPICPPLIPDILAQEEGFEPHLGRLAILPDILPRPHHIPEGFVLHTGNVHRAEVARAQQPRQLPGIAAISLDSVPGPLGNLRGGHAPTLEVPLGQIPLQPVPTGTGFVDAGHALALALQLAHRGSDILLPGAERPQGDDFGATVLGDVRDRDGVFVDIQSDEKGASVCQG